MIRLLRGIRAQETSYAIRMARIRAFNMALYFFNTPLVSFIVFTVVGGSMHCCMEHVRQPLAAVQPPFHIKRSEV